MTSPEARKDILRKKGKCFLCLRSGNLSRNSQIPVKCFKCQGSHHVSLCSKIEPRKDPKQEEEKKTGVTPAINMFVGQSQESVLLQTAIVNVVRPDNESYVQGCRLVFDSCSQRTYITEDLAHNLALPIIGRDSLLIKTFGENDARLRMCNIVQVGIKTEYGGTVYVRAYVVPVICGPLVQPPASVVQNEYDHLRGLPLADNPGMVDPSMNIQILVGADYYWSLVEGAVVRGGPHEPIALATKLGYVLSGPVVMDSQNDRADQYSVNLTTTHVLKVESVPIADPLIEEVKRFGDYESLGIQETGPTFYCKFRSEVKFVEDQGRYQVRLPFKENHNILPDNFALAEARLNSLLRRLKSKPEIARQYGEVIKDQLSNGIIEQVEPSNNNGVGRVHYIPHHEIIRSDKQTTKLRVVYDASAKSERELPSLNDCLYAGPPLSPLIFDILLRFRVHSTALTGDIEKAFLNISVDPDDRDFLRFLWVDNPTSKNPKLLL